MAQKISIQSFESFKERNCSVSICLDLRSNRNKKERKNPLSIRFTINKKRLYHHLVGNYTEEEFSNICNSIKSKSANYEEKKRFIKYAEDYYALLKNINPGQNLTLEIIKEAIKGKGKKNEESFLGVWQQIIDQKIADGYFSTGESYDCALKSFKRIMGEDAISGLNITTNDIARWNDGMKNGVEKDGKIVGKIADATRGIYLRTCRVVWNECLSRGYLSNTPYPFSNKKEKGLISIPKGGNRKTCHLEVNKMSELYKIFIKKSYPETWTNHYKEMVHFSLGLFLAQYLCNGFNLADAAELTYDEYYYATDGKAFRFERKKTRNRSENNAEVIIPIIEPLRNILKEIGAEPKLGAYVFPQILNGVIDPEIVRKRVSLENSNIQDRVIRVCKDILEWELRPSSTWCRHSFANNLKDAGVEREYISESMGHSVGKNVTSIYLDNYPLDKQFEYNSKLLSLDESQPSLEQLDDMSPEEMKKLLVQLLAKNQI